MENMQIHTLWGERKGFEGGFPELMVAWSEYQIEDNPEGFDEACAAEAATWGDELASTRLVLLTVDIEKIANLFNPIKITADVGGSDVC